MPRKKNVIAPEAQTMDLVVQKKDKNLSVANQVFSMFGILNGDYERFVFVEAAKNMKTVIGKGAVALGAIILAIKEHEQHGSFLKALEEINIHPRKAQRYMNIAKRYGKSEKNVAFTDLSFSQWDILDALTDPELEKLADGEEVKGLTLDAIEELPATEVRKRLREAEKKLESQKNRDKEKIDKLNEEIEQLQFIIDCRVLTEKEKAEKAIESMLEELRKKLFAAIHQARFYFGDALDIIAAARQLEGVTFPMLEKWAKAEYEEIAGFNELFETLDDELNYISVDKSDEKR